MEVVAPGSLARLESGRTLEIRLLGGMSLAWGDIVLPTIVGQRSRSLLAYLIVHRHRPQARDLVAGTFWPDLPDVAARRRLSQSLWQIGRVLDLVPTSVPLLLVESDNLRFNTAALYWLDTHQFEMLLKGQQGDVLNGEHDGPADGEIGRPMASTGGPMAGQPGLSSQPPTTDTGPSPIHESAGRPSSVSVGAPALRDAGLSELRHAIALYRGEFLAGVYDDWLRGERERLREMYLSGLGRLVQLCKAGELYEEALLHARSLVEQSPLLEEGHREVMRLCYLLGRPQEAVRQYNQCREFLADELGVSPSAATTELHQEIVSRTAESQAIHLPRPAGRPLSPLLDGVGQVSLVGRETERAVLLDCLEEALKGSACVVLVEGEAGIGKTRLLQELTRDAEWRGVRVIWGRGRKQAELPPYNPLAEALRSALSPLRASQLAQSVDPMWLREACSVLPELATWLPDLPPRILFPPDMQPSRLLLALSQVVLGLSSLAPHVLILDDLQWIDQSTLQALASIAQALHERRSLAYSPLLLVGSFRGLEARERSALWEALQAIDRSASCRRLELGPLSPSEAAELVRRCLGMTRQAPRFEQRVHGETAGNPLFILETLRALRDEGLLHRSETGEWCTPWDETSWDYAELPLPTQVYQTISSRLTWLGPDEKETLRMAAVLGDACDLPLLVHASGIEERWTLAALGELVRRRLLEETLAGLQFSHDRVREVTYAEIDPADRKRLHQQAGQAVEALHPQSVEALAYHFVRSEQWSLALTYSQKAGDRARTVYATKEAIDHYGRALQAWERMQSSDLRLGAALHQARGETCQEGGRFDEAQVDLDAAESLSAAAGRPDRQALALNSLSYLNMQRGSYRAAVHAAQQALHLAQACDSQSQRARALLNQANAVRNLGQPRQAIQFYRQAATLLERQRDLAGLADCLNRLGYAYLFTGDYRAAQQVISEALVARRRLGDRVGISYSLTNLTALCLTQGHFVQACDAAKEALETARGVSDPYGEDAALFNIGLVALEQGSPEQALPFLEQSRAMAARIGDRPLEAEANAEIGRALALRGDLQQAREMLARALHLMRQWGECWHVPKTHVYLSSTLSRLGDHRRSLAHARQALQIAQQIGDPWSLGLAHRAMGQCAAVTRGATGEPDPSSHFEESVAVLRQVGARAELARSLAAHAGFLIDAQTAANAQRAGSLLQEARALFAEMAMSMDLAALDACTSARAPVAQPSIRLPRVEAPTGRPLRGHEWVTVAWTAFDAQDQAVAGKVARRQRRLLRLLREAAEQGGAPTVDDLADALGTSRTTIKRDLASLRHDQPDLRTRGSRR